MFCKINKITRQKEYYLSSFSKKPQSKTIAGYILSVVARIAKNRALFRDEYAVICKRLADKYTNLNPSTLDTLMIERDGEPSIYLPYGAFDAKKKKFAIRLFEMMPNEKDDSDFCYLNKKGGCIYCNKFLKNGEKYSCNKCYKIRNQLIKDENEAAELRSLTRQLKRLCHEKN
jgi:hypothetical protein